MVQKNHKTFKGDTREEVEHAIATCKANAYSGHPSEKVFKKSWAVNEQALYLDLYLSNAHAIFGLGVNQSG